MTERLIGAAPALTLLAALAVAAIWAIAHSIRGGGRRNDKRGAWLAACAGDRPEPAHPGTNQQLLDQCNAIFNADQARKEKP